MALNTRATTRVGARLTIRGKKNSPQSSPFSSPALPWRSDWTSLDWLLLASVFTFAGFAFQSSVNSIPLRLHFGVETKAKWGIRAHVTSRELIIVREESIIFIGSRERFGDGPTLKTTDSLQLKFVSAFYLHKPRFWVRERTRKSSTVTHLVRTFGFGGHAQYTCAGHREPLNGICVPENISFTGVKTVFPADSTITLLCQALI